MDAYPGFTRFPQHQHRPLPRKRFPVNGRIHAFVGYGTSVFSAIDGPEGLIWIDTGDNPAASAEAQRELRAITNKPVVGVILTHSHPDHTLGASGLLEGERADIPVWARANFGGEQAGFRGLEKIAAQRAGRQFGMIIPPERYTVNALVTAPNAAFSGTGPKPLAPNNFFDGQKHVLRLAGLELELHAAPGETSDQLFVWSPEDEILFCADNMYRSFPNLYPIRGSAYRDVAAWAASLRRMRPLNPKAVVMGHTEPAFGEEGLSMLENYAAALQHVFDETLKGMNEGRGPDELAATVQLPEHLRKLEYLGEYYGCVPWSVRSIYAALLGWFDGNPTKLAPLTPDEEATHLAVLAGGADKLLQSAKKALTEGDHRWAARLADICLTLPKAPANLASEARRIKADALEAMSEFVLPITGKNYLLSCALELRKLPPA